jgi:hypothetical protein
MHSDEYQYTHKFILMSAIRLNLELSTQTSLYSSFEQICDELEALESTGELNLKLLNPLANLKLLNPLTNLKLLNLELRLHVIT